MGKWGPLPVADKVPPATFDPLKKTPISMCGHQAQGQNSATKSSPRKNLGEI